MGHMVLVVSIHWQTGADGATLDLASQAQMCFRSGFTVRWAAPSSLPLREGFGSFDINLFFRPFFSQQQRHPTPSKRQLFSFVTRRSITSSIILCPCAWPFFDLPTPGLLGRPSRTCPGSSVSFLAIPLPQVHSLVNKKQTSNSLAPVHKVCSVRSRVFLHIPNL